MAKKLSTVHSVIEPRNVRPLQLTEQDVNGYLALSQIGIHLDRGIIGQMMDGIGMDAGDDVGLTPVPLSSLTTASITTPVQFLQNWLPGFVRVITAARKIDDLIGIQTVGSWEDEEVVQGILEPEGTAQPYGDYTNVPLSSWNANYVARTIVRFEQGMSVGMLEEARAARVRIASAAEKRAGAAIMLDIQRNRVGFYGYNDGSGQTYGFLNDPNLPAYVSAPTGNWATGTFITITADIRTALAGLQVQSMDQIDVQKDQITMGLAMEVYQFLTVTTTYSSFTVREWLVQNYPNVRVISAPELGGANAGANVAYFYAEKMNDGGSDGGMTFAQVVPSKFMTLGVEKRSKSYIEDYSNATAGVMVKRPIAVYRQTGL